MEDYEYTFMSNKSQQSNEIGKTALLELSVLWRSASNPVSSRKLCHTSKRFMATLNCHYCAIPNG